MNIVNLLAGPLASIAPDTEIQYNPWHQIGLGALLSGATVGTARLASGSLRGTLPLGIAGFAAGLGSLPLHNALVRYKQKQQVEEAKEAIRAHLDSTSGLGSSVKSIGESIKNIHSTLAKTPDLSKQANFISGALGAAGRGAWGAAKAVGSSLLPTPAKAPLGEKIMGVAVKGVAAGGLGYGTFKGIDNLKKSNTSDYTTTLRNNILSGRIRPSELNGSELQQVKTLGFR